MASPRSPGQPIVDLADELPHDGEDRPAARGRANELRAPIAGIGDPLEVAVRLEVLDELGHRLLGHVRPVGEDAHSGPAEDDEGDVHRILATPGDVVHVPGGRSHTVRNESGEEAMAYVVFTPAAGMERFLRAAAALGADGPPAPADVLALATRHGIAFTGPVPGDAQGS